MGILAVSELAEGQGVGRALLDAVESGAHERGYRFITLNVFAANARARVSLHDAERCSRPTRGRGYRFMTLNVFAANARARAVYERAGFALDALRYY